MRVRSAALILAVAILVIAGVSVVALGESRESAEPSASGSTLETTWIDPDGNGRLQVGPGEGMVERTDLAPASPGVEDVGSLVQISDAHVRDEESPARAVLLDRLSPQLSEAFRPQEALSAQVLDAALRSASAAGPDAVLQTGDLVDSAQANELDQALSLLEGGEVNPDSGAPGYDGLQELSNPDPFIYRPDLDSPRHPGLLDEAQEPFSAPGLSVPWYSALGNHDLLVQGEVAPTPGLEAIAIDDEELVALDPDLEAPEGVTRLTPELVDLYLGAGLPGRTEETPADPERRHLTDSEVTGLLREASGVEGAGPRLEYSVDVRDRLRVITMDLVNRAGGAPGTVTPESLAFLREELERAGERWVVVASHQPLANSEGGDGALAILDKYPQVIATVSGHTHSTSIEPREAPSGGYWQISTPALSDYPQQARALSVAETEDGVAIETWMLDTAPGRLPDIARELAYLDAGGGRPDEDQGEAQDRNARLYLPR